MNPMPVTIVIPFYRQAATLAACLRALYTHTSHPDWQVIVVDDGGVEDLRAAMPKAANLTVIRRVNGGVARALNAGFRAAAGRDVVRLHADVVIETSDWLNQLAAAAYQHPQTAAVGVRLVSPDGRIQSEGRSLVTGLGFHRLHASLRAFQPETAGGKRAEVDSVSGALAYYRRAALDEVGGLDEGYGPAWFEDDDFCFAARRLGYKVFVEPAVRAVHYARSAPPTFGVTKRPGDQVLASLVRGFKETVLKLQARRWEEKWGWHPFYPDVNEIRRLYEGTEVLWRIGEPLRFKPSQEFPTVDCCVVTWNSLGMIKRTLESLAKVDYPADRIRVIVTNNGSTDGTTEYLAELAASYPFELTAINLPCNAGVSAGLNFAFEAGQSELVARLDDDIVLPRDWLAVLLNDLRQRPFAGVAGLKTIGDDDRRAIQWGPGQMYPHSHSHGEEPDAGQASGLTRVSHIPGCCNLFRRDALRRGGQIDVRYSPTQCDDLDHCLVLIQAGYEVLHEGRTHVLHKRTTGLDRSAAGTANLNANYAKLYGKWGDDIFEVVENTLIFSREGRYLPLDGDTSDCLARGPAPGEFPRKATNLDAHTERFIRQIYEGQGGTIPAGTELYSLVDQHLARARALERDGNLRAAGDAILIVVNFAPTRVEGYRALAAHHRDLGQSALARTAARRGLHLSPQDPVLIELSQVTAEMIRTREAAVVQASRPPSVEAESASWSVTESPRVLLVGSYQRRPGNDELSYVREYRVQLIAAGIRAELSLAPQPDPRGFDVAHLWNSSQPHETLSQIKAIRALRPATPILLTPSYCDLALGKWNGRLVSSIFMRSTRAQIELGLAEFAAGKIVVTGETKPDASPFALQASELGAVQRRLFQAADRLLPFTAEEGALINLSFGVDVPFAPLPAGVDTAALAAASAAAFFKQYRLRDFVLMVGPVKPSRNQIIPLLALQSGSVPVVVIGEHVNPDYVAACRKAAPPGSLFLESLSPELMAGAYRAARVFVAPAWAQANLECALAAAFAGCSLALSEQLADRAKFAGYSQFFNPSSLAGIRVAVQTALSGHSARAALRPGLTERLAAIHDWSVVVRSATASYESVLAHA